MNVRLIVPESAYPESAFREQSLPMRVRIGWGQKSVAATSTDTEFCNRVSSYLHLIPEFTRHSCRWWDTLCPRSCALSCPLNLSLNRRSKISILPPF